MKVFLAATGSRESRPSIVKIPYILESFYSLKNEKTLKRILQYPKENFLLDSGAFTFMNNCKGKVNFDEYLDKYIEFINKYDIKYFFELDVDVIVGYEKVKQLRKRLERETNKKCIPVWHKSRGLDDFIAMCKEYDYVSIGGIVVKEIEKKDWVVFPKLIEIAHKYNCKIHGLGFTATKELHKYHFDSVDSTNWISGSKFGSLHLFNGSYIESKSFKNKRAKRIEIDEHNINEWIKFQKYAYKHL
jgi:hypothetical protein